MRTAATAAGRWGGAIAVGVVAALAVLLVGRPFAGKIASAHGKELAIAVSPLIPDPDQPLTRLYRVHVVYENDREPVEGGTVELTGRRADGAADLSGQELTEVDGGQGLYVGEVAFPRFGSWEMQLRVQAAQGQGDGAVAFTDEISPGALVPGEEAALREEAERVINLQLSFGFDWWPDVANIAMRVLHSMAGLAYFVATGLVFGVAWFGVPAHREGLAVQLKGWFLPAAAASLLVLLGAGLYSAAYDAPITYPGVYDISTMRHIPYGDAYLAAFFVKVALFVVLLALALHIRVALGQWDASDSNGAGAAALRRATALNAAVGLVVVADVAVLIYLHYISHLGVFLPET